MQRMMNNDSSRTSDRLGRARRDDDPAFRRARARLAALAMHAKRPDVARTAGRKGGLATAGQYSLGAKAWGVAMSLRKHHGSKFQYTRSRAPTGPGVDGNGIPEPGPVTAQNGSSREAKMA